MAEGDVTLSYEQVRDIFKALDGIRNLITKPGNPAELYAIMSNIWAIQVTLTGIPRGNFN